MSHTEQFRPGSRPLSHDTLVESASLSDICRFKLQKPRTNHRTPTPHQPGLPLRGNRGHRLRRPLRRSQPKTPREVRNALVHALADALAGGKKHAATGREVTVSQPVDTFSSAPWFDDFRECVSIRGLEGPPLPVTPPRTWLLTLGWRRHDLLSVPELPKTG